MRAFHTAERKGEITAVGCYVIDDCAACRGTGMRGWAVCRACEGKGSVLRSDDDAAPESANAEN